MHYYMVQYYRFDSQLSANGFPMPGAPMISTLCAKVVEIAYPLEYASDITALERDLLSNEMAHVQVISWQALKGGQRPRAD